jgi:dTDP-4-dehydrorhamnose reductase
MAIAVADHFGLNSSLITAVTEDAFEQPARRPPKTGFDISKAKRELNYNPTSFSEGLKKTFKNS